MKLVGIVLAVMLGVILVESYFLLVRPNQTAFDVENPTGATSQTPGSSSSGETSNAPSATDSSTPPDETSTESSNVTTSTVVPDLEVFTRAVPEFTLRYADHSYDTPATHSIDPYTGQEITHPGYHVENKTIEAVIKNNVGASYYNFRIKGHYADKWMFGNPDFYDAFSVTNAASASDYTVITVVELSSLPQSVSKGGKIDVQVQGLFGTYRAVVYGPKLGRTAYDFYFNGTASDWSETQTITIP